MRRILLAGALSGAALVISAVPAEAAYPPGTSTFIGTFVPGQSASTTFTGYMAGSNVNYTVNGTPDGSGPAGPDGSVPIAISITDPHVAVNGNTPIAVNFGTTTVTGSGVSQAGTPIANSVTLNIVQASSSTPTTTPASGNSGSGNSGSTSSGSSTTLAFTGADIAATVAGGLALLAVGSVLVIATRRRSHRGRKAA
jgi:hypothetical protein